MARDQFARCAARTGNEIVLAVGPDGQAVFSEVAILYTSNKLAVTKEMVPSRRRTDAGDEESRLVFTVCDTSLGLFPCKPVDRLIRQTRSG